MPPPPLCVAALLAALLSFSKCSITNETKNFYVTAVVGGSSGEWVAKTLGELAAARLRQYDVPTIARPPPPACIARPLSWDCQNAVLHLLAQDKLVAAMLPLPAALGLYPNSWQLRDYGIVDIGDLIYQPVRLQCVAPPPARSLLDLADADVAAHYTTPPPPSPFLKLVKTCPSTACATLLVADPTVANQTSTVIERHQLQAQVYLLDKQALINMRLTNNSRSIICDFAAELGLTLPETWRNLGPSPCEDTVECPFEGRRLAKLVNTRALLGMLRALPLLQHLRLDIRNLRDLCDHAKRNGTAVAVQTWLNAHPDHSTLKEIRTVTFVPAATTLEEQYQQLSLSSAAALAESKAPSNANVLFKVEVQVKCAAVPEYLEMQISSNFGQLSALAGPACSAGWHAVSHKSSGHAVPMLAYTAQTPPGGAALLAAGSLQDEASALGAWIAAQGWHRLALLAPADHARDAAPALHAHLAVNVALDDPRSTPNWELIEEWARRAANADARILYVWSEDVRVVAGAICIASRYQLTPDQGNVWLLPAFTAAALSAAARDAAGPANCHVAPLLDGYFTVAPAWRALWDRWDTSTAPLPLPYTTLPKEWNTQCARDVRTGKGGCAWPPPASAALLYDLLSLWIRAVERVITAMPYASDNLHQSEIIDNIIANATKHEFTGLTGNFKWRTDKDNAWTRISTMVIAQWDGANATWRQVATWNGTTLKERAGVIRWRTANGRAPDDGDAHCALAGAARTLHVSCAAAWALVLLLAAGALLALLAVAALRWRQRAERSFRRRLAALGLHALPPVGTDRWEVPRERVVINRKLGTGAFGTVYGGHALLGERGWSAVAVKTLKPGANTEEKLDFLAEAEAMKRLDHKNIVRLLGVVTKTEPVCTVMEFMLYGDLKTYLLARRHVADECEVGARRLTAMALDAARALSYLAEQRWVHRDVAARNCLVSARRVVKLADFGMARRVYDGDYYRLRRRSMLPVRWMAPEALAAGEFSAASDVWAFGVLLYEMVTLGALPFAGLSNAEVLGRVQGGRALDPPPGVKPPLEALLRACWARRASARPLAAEVATFLAEQPRLVAPCSAPPLDALPLAQAHHANSLWRAHDAPGSAATDTTYLSDARDTDRFLTDDLAL